MLLISRTACTKCWVDGKRDIANCKVCGEEENIYFGYDCVKNFNDYLINNLSKQAHKNKGKIYIFAHNAKDYDGHFIRRVIFERRLNEPPKIIMTGHKILKFDLNNFRFLDFLNLFMQDLASLPKAF